MSRPDLAPPLDELLTHEAFIRAVARGVLGADPQVEDVVQDTLVTALRRGPRRPGALRGWLGAVARNASLKQRRSQSRRSAREARAPRRSPVPTPEEVLAREEVRRNLVEHLLALDEPYRGALLLRYYSELPVKDVAEHLGVPLETARTRLRRGLAALRERMDGAEQRGQSAWRSALLPLAGLDLAAHATAMGHAAAGVAAKKVAAAALLVVAVGGGVWWSASRPKAEEAPPSLVASAEQPEDEEPAPTSPAPTESPGPTLKGGTGAGREADGATPAATSPKTPSHATIHGKRITGRVVSAQKQPVPGAAVQLLLAGRPAARLNAKDDGSFELTVPVPPGPDALLAVLHVADGRGAAAVQFVVLRNAPDWDQAPVGASVVLNDVVLQSAEEVAARVRTQGEPPARIQLAVLGDEPGAWPLPLHEIEVRSGVPGDLGWLPAGRYRLIATAAGWGRGTTSFAVPRGSTEPIALELPPSPIFRVRVLDEASGKPVAGATLHIEEHHASGTRALWPAPAVAPTDADGWTQVPGLAPSARLRLLPRAKGYPPQEHLQMPRRVGPQHPHPGDVDVADGTHELRLHRGHALRWPLEKGDVPLPPDGTRIAFTDWIVRRGNRKEPPPPDGVIEQGQLVVRGHAGGPLMWYAKTPAGDVALVGFHEPGTPARTVQFNKPRRVTVRLTYPDGAPAPSLWVRLEFESGHHSPVTAESGPDGAAVLEGFHGHKFIYARPEVIVATDRQFQQRVAHAGTVHLEKAETSIEAVVQRARRLEIRVLQNGVPSLPTYCGVEIDHQRREAVRDDGAGTLTVTWRPGNAEGEATLVLSMRDHLSQTVKVPRAFVPHSTIDVEIWKASNLEVSVNRPRDGGRFAVQLLSWSEQAAGWFEVRLNQRDQYGRYIKFSGKDPARIVRLHPGRYRFLDHRSGTYSEPFEINPGGGDTRVELDLSKSGFVTGRIELPKDVPFVVDYKKPGGVFLSAEGPPPRNTNWNWFGLRGLVKPDGTFKIRVPGDRPVTLKPFQRDLMPAPEGGTAVVTEPTDGIVLRLVHAHRASFVLSETPRYQVNPGQPRPQTIRLYRGEKAEGKPVFESKGWVEGSRVRFAAFQPGTYTLWFDAAPFAPLVVTNVVLKAGENDLGTLRVSKGSTFVLRLEVPKGKSSGDVYVSAQRVGDDVVQRRHMWTGVTEARLSGLGPGRWRVGASASGGSFDEVIEFDGTSDVKRTLKLK